jgi:hypothetical protein
MSDSDAMRTGDVMLVKGLTGKSKILLMAQKAVYLRAQSSHVLLGLGAGTFIHATGDGGVHLQFLLDELAEVTDSWRVIRLKSLTINQTDKLRVTGLSFLRQGYNLGYLLPEKEHTSFCSELVAKAYRDAGISLLDGKGPSSVTPAAFDRLADEATEWEDVTAEYKEHLPEFKRNEETYRMEMENIKILLANRHQASAGREAIFEAMSLIAAKENKPEMQALVDEQKRFLKENRALRFWDEKDAEP